MWPLFALCVYVTGLQDRITTLVLGSFNASAWNGFILEANGPISRIISNRPRFGDQVEIIRLSLQTNPGQVIGNE